MGPPFYFFLIFGFLPLLGFWLSDTAFSLSQNCHGEGCTGDGCIGNYCTGKGCIGEKCSGDGCRGDYCAGNSCKGASCGASTNDPGTGSDPGSGTKLFPTLKGQKVDCSVDCILCGGKLKGRCEANNNALNYRVGFYANNSQYALDNSNPKGIGIDSSFSNFSKRADFSIRTKYIVITFSGNYREVYSNLYKDDLTFGSFSIRNGTKVIWINLDEHHSHTIKLLDKSYKASLVTTVIPFGGTAEYTFTSVGQYLFFDPQNKISKATITVY